MSFVTLYTTDTCPYCRNAKTLLARKGIETREIMFNLRRGNSKK